VGWGGFIRAGRGYREEEATQEPRRAGARRWTDGAEVGGGRHSHCVVDWWTGRHRARRGKKNEEGTRPPPERGGAKYRTRSREGITLLGKLDRDPAAGARVRGRHWPSPSVSAN
jgi:hypothetical protein